MKRWHVKYGNELWYDMTSYHSAAVFDRTAMYSKDFYDSLYQFFLEYQPDLSVVYDELATLISNSASDDEIIDLIRERYPEIYNYKGNTMELQKEVDRLKQESAEEKLKLAALESAFKESQKPRVNDCMCADCFNQSGCICKKVDVQRIGIHMNDDAWVGVGTFETTALPYIRPEIYNGVLSGLKVQADKQDDGKTKWTFTSESSEPKPSPEPTEVVYVLRIQPDSILHAKMIEFADEWSYADELIGIEKHYVFE